MEKMIGILLKRLFPAIGRYIWYHVTKIFGRSGPAATAAVSSASHVGVPNDDIGLDPTYERPIQWPSYRKNTPDEKLLSDPLYQLWSTTSRGHKWSHYFAVYEEVFSARRALPMRILEIGVLEGSSLRLWKKYFAHPDTLIVGIDITPDCIKLDSPADGIRVRIGSQADGEFLKQVMQEFGPFDLIIDDGSHLSSHIITSFNHLYAAGLKNSGIYFVEDLHANYWLPWRDSKKGFFDLCQEMIEHMHAHYRTAPSQAFLTENPSEQPMATLEVPIITTMVREIRMFDSIVAIYKTDRAYIPYYLGPERS
jgi:hypothetical protein